MDRIEGEGLEAVFVGERRGARAEFVAGCPAELAARRRERGQCQSGLLGQRALRVPRERKRRPPPVHEQHRVPSGQQPLRERLKVSLSKSAKRTRAFSLSRARKTKGSAGLWVFFLLFSSDTLGAVCDRAAVSRREVVYEAHRAPASIPISPRQFRAEPFVVVGAVVWVVYLDRLWIAFRRDRYRVFWKSYIRTARDAGAIVWLLFRPRLGSAAQNTTQLPNSSGRDRRSVGWQRARNDLSAPVSRETPRARSSSGIVVPPDVTTCWCSIWRHRADETSLRQEPTRLSEERSLYTTTSAVDAL